MAPAINSSKNRVLSSKRTRLSNAGVSNGLDKFMTLKPRVSEKAYGQSQTGNVYSFIVPGDANKLTVASAVAAQFDVTVEAVNITNVKGKPKRAYRKRRYISGERSDYKKAYVTVKAGDNIPIFAAEEEAEAKAAKAAVKEAKGRKKEAVK